MAEFFPVLLPATSLEELHTSLAPKHDDVKGDEDVKESNEELASIPDPANDVHDVNGEGSMEPSTVQNQEEAQSVHVITANLSSGKRIYPLSKAMYLKHVSESQNSERF